MTSSNYRKIDDGGIFLNEEIIFRESFVAYNKVRRKLGEFEPLQRRIAVSLVLLFRCAVKFRHDREEGYLGDDIFLDVI